MLFLLALVIGPFVPSVFSSSGFFLNGRVLRIAAVTFCSASEVSVLSGGGVAVSLLRDASVLFSAAFLSRLSVAADCLGVIGAAAFLFLARAAFAFSLAFSDLSADFLDLSSWALSFCQKICWLIRKNISENAINIISLP